jgi:AFG3 family protein
VKKNEPQSSRPAYGKIILIIAGISLVLFAVNFLGNYLPSSHQTNWNEFESKMLSRGAVEMVVITNHEAAGVYIKKEFKDDPAFKEVMQSPFGKQDIKPGPHYIFNIGSPDVFERKLAEVEAHVPVAKRVVVIYDDSSRLKDIWTWILPVMLVFFLLRLAFGSRVDGGIGSSLFNFGRSTARLQDSYGRSTTNFDQVAGLVEAKQEVKEIVDFLKDPLRYTRLGAKIPKGVIIVGPPGTGKTLLAKAVAGEAQVPFFSLSGSEFVEMFVGVGASRVRDLFKRAKEKAPCIVFIDEIDAVGRSRGKNALYSGVNDERESTLNQLLTEMDGFGTNSGVIVLAATNRADVLDPALWRPGRFDRHIYLELPSQVERNAIFQVHVKPLALAENVDTHFLAAQTPGFSGADIANTCNEAALIAARRKKDKVEKQDFVDAMDRIIVGVEKKSKILSAEEKKLIAYHEAGHAVVGWLLRYTDPLVKVSIIPRGKSLGAAWYLPEERQIRTYSNFVQHLSATLGGRAAEEVIFGEISSGAIDDLEKVTKEAYSMVAYFGFNKKLGNVSFYDSTGRSEMGMQKPYSEETGRIIDCEVRKLVEECYEQAKNILTQYKQQLILIAELLLKKEVIFQEEVEAVLGKKGENAGTGAPVVKPLMTEVV